MSDDVLNAFLEQADAGRGKAIARLREVGLPAPNDEYWRWTNISEHLTGFVPANASIPANEPPAPMVTKTSVRLVFVNGQLIPPSDLPEGLSCSPARKISACGSFAALSEAFAGPGAHLALAEGVRLEGPVEIVFIGQPPMAIDPHWHPRFTLEVGDGASLALIERHMGAGRYLSNVQVDIDLNAGASLDWFRIQEESPVAVHIHQSRVRLAGSTRLTGHLLGLGARMSRNETRIRLEGADSVAELQAAYLMDGARHFDLTGNIDHLAPGCASRLDVRGALDEAGRGVFQGKVYVDRIAQGTDACQLSQALLLSDKAEIDAKPELEIYADDVKCSHGSSCGDLDPEQLFYARARGIDDCDARQMLIRAFLARAFADIETTETGAALLGRIDEALSRKRT
ncbi:MAG: Fe-S cluster assembly protein SufD [Pseudomonadota bacterium]|nr:Fe-S cluster assembly protein SufD [Pseudomonadota bacterium]